MRDDPIANVAAGWKRNAGGAVHATPHLGVSTALWTEHGFRRQEVQARPNATTYSLSFTERQFDGEAFIDGKPIFSGAVPAGACNFVQPGQAPRGVFRGPWRQLHVYIPDALFRRMIDTEEMRLPSAGFELVNPRWAVLPELRRWARELKEELEGGLPFGLLKIDGLCLNLVIEILRFHSNLGCGRTIGSARCGGLAPWQLNRAREAMLSHLQSDISLEVLARIAGLSPTHFSRAFKQSMGLPPFAWLRGRRIDRAKELLTDPRNGLAEIALAVGFSAQPQFTTAFKRATGLTPGQWRRERLS